MKSNLMTNSRAKDARACKRLEHIKYEEGYRPVERAETEAFFGSLMHHGLEAWFRAVMAKLPRTQWLELALAAIRAVKADPYELAKAEVMMTGYHARWCDEDFEVLAVEAEFRTELINPDTGHKSHTWVLGGKIDAVIRDARQRILIAEHKTSSEDVSSGSDYWKRLRLDSQISTYFDGAKALGFDAEACLYDVLGKPGQRPYRATPLESRKFKADGTLYANQRAFDETPDEYKARLVEVVMADPSKYFSRGEVVRLEAELDEARADIWAETKTLRENKLAGRKPRNPESCVRYGSACPYFGVCTGEASLDDPRLFTRTAKVHPELNDDVPSPAAVDAAAP